MIFRNLYSSLSNIEKLVRVYIFKENVGFVNGFGGTKINGTYSVGNHISITTAYLSGSGGYWWILRLDANFYQLYKGLGYKLYIDYVENSNQKPSCMSFSSTQTSYDYNGQPVASFNQASGGERVVSSVSIDSLLTDSSKPCLLLRNNPGSNITAYIYNVWLSL